MGKVIRLFRKTMRKFANKFNILTIVIGCFTLLFSVSYAQFIINTEEFRATDMYMGDLLYTHTVLEAPTTQSLTINNDKSVVIPANTTGTVMVNITSQNPVLSKYKLRYRVTSGTCTSPNCKVLISDATGWNEYGLLKASNSNFPTKKIKVVVVNNQNAAVTIAFNIKGGYSHNDYNSIAAVTNYTDFSSTRYVDVYDGIYLKDIVKDNLECTPGANTPCMYGGESARNYVSYNGTVYRMLGVYLINSAEYVKMIQTNRIGTATTYANVSTALTNYYNSLPSATRNVFFTGTASSITTTEYGAIGYENSYAYNNTQFLTSTTSGSNVYVVTENTGVLTTIAQTTNSYIKPVLTLKTDAYINYGGTGTSANPYVISEKVDLIITKITINGTTATKTPTSGQCSLVPTCTGGNVTFEDTTYSLVVEMTGIPTICSLKFTGTGCQ